jgi:glutathione S-transferase
MTAYRLHYFPESGNSYKLALMLTLCGQTFQPVWTDFGGGVTRTPAWRATVNPMGEIPVLEEDGIRLPRPRRSCCNSPNVTAGSAAKLPKKNSKYCAGNHKLTGYVATYRYQRTFIKSPNPQVQANSSSASRTSSVF